MPFWLQVLLGEIGLAIMVAGAAVFFAHFPQYTGFVLAMGWVGVCGVAIFVLIDMRR